MAGVIEMEKLSTGTAMPVSTRVPEIALELSVRSAVRLPGAVGWKVTMIVQLAPGASVAAETQLSDSLKSVALVPEAEIPVIFKTAVPALVRVTAAGALPVPTMRRE